MKKGEVYSAVVVRTARACAARTARWSGSRQRRGAAQRQARTDRHPHLRAGTRELRTERFMKIVAGAGSALFEGHQTMNKIKEGDR